MLLQQDVADAMALGVRKAATVIANGKPPQRFGLVELESLVQETVSAAYAG